MTTREQPVTIVMAEDDDEDFALCQQAFEEARVGNPLIRVGDGEELMDFLLRRGKHQDPPRLPGPVLVMLDLRMPKKDGFEALREIRAHPALRRTPIVVLTTSKEDEDIARTYDMGGNSYITKPVGLGDLLAVIQALKSYWLEIVEFPGSPPE